MFPPSAKRMNPKEEHSAPRAPPPLGSPGPGGGGRGLPADWERRGQRLLPASESQPLCRAGASCVWPAPSSLRTTCRRLGLSLSGTDGQAQGNQDRAEPIWAQLRARSHPSAICRAGDSRRQVRRGEEQGARGPESSCGQDLALRPPDPLGSGQEAPAGPAVWPVGL